MKVSKNKQNTQVDELIKDFLDSNGYVAAFSNDPNFIRLLRNMIVKHLAISHDCYYSSADEGVIRNILKSQAVKGKKILLFVESEIYRNPTSNFIQEIKQHYDDLLIIVMTPEVNKSMLIFLHELGVNNFITKPLTLNTLLEKFANTIKPPSEFSKNIDKGKELLNSGALDQALEISQNLLKEKPNSPAVLMLLGDSILKWKGMKMPLVVTKKRMLLKNFI